MRRTQTSKLAKSALRLATLIREVCGSESFDMGFLSWSVKL